MKVSKKAKSILSVFLMLIMVTSLFSACSDKEAEINEVEKTTEEEKAVKAQVMEEALKEACTVPMEIMEKCGEAIDIIEDFAKKGSVIAISDAGVGAAFLKAALEGASLNVFINTKSMMNREYADALNQRADELLAKYTKKAEGIFESVKVRLR